MAATGFHSKVERVFLVMRVRFVGVYSGNVNRGFFLAQTGVFVRFWVFFGTFWGFFGICRGFFWYISGDFLVGTTSPPNHHTEMEDSKLCMRFSCTTHPI